jgi:hypothetical protein
VGYASCDWVQQNKQRSFDYRDMEKLQLKSKAVLRNDLSKFRPAIGVRWSEFSGEVIAAFHQARSLR